MIRQTIRGWTLHERSDKTLDDLARMFNASFRGWIDYYGRYYRSARSPDPTAHRPDIGAMGPSEVEILTAPSAAHTAVARPHRGRQPSLFAHWRLLQGYG